MCVPVLGSYVGVSFFAYWGNFRGVFCEIGFIVFIRRILAGFASTYLLVKSCMRQFLVLAGA